MDHKIVINRIGIQKSNNVALETWECDRNQVSNRSLSDSYEISSSHANSLRFSTFVDHFPFLSFVWWCFSKLFSYIIRGFAILLRWIENGDANLSLSSMLAFVYHKYKIEWNMGSKAVPRGFQSSAILDPRSSIAFHIRGWFFSGEMADSWSKQVRKMWA